MALKAPFMDLKQSFQQAEFKSSLYQKSLLSFENLFLSYTLSSCGMNFKNANFGPFFGLYSVAFVFLVFLCILSNLVLRAAGFLKKRDSNDSTRLIHDSIIRELT